MKTTLFSFLLILTTIGNVRSQITVLNENGDEIQDNQEFTFNIVDPEEGKLHFYVRNDTDEVIKIEGKVLRVEGSDGSQANFCLGQCLPQAKEGDFVPDSGEGYEIGANVTDNSPGTYFLNLDDTNDYIKYQFEIYQIDNSGNQIGTPINIYYIYDENLSVDKNQLTNTKIYPTVASSIININLKENATAEIFNLQGKLVQTLQLKESLSSIDISTFSSGIYLIKLKGESNYTATKKFVKK